MVCGGPMRSVVRCIVSCCSLPYPCVQAVTGKTEEGFKLEAADFPSLFIDWSTGPQHNYYPLQNPADASMAHMKDSLNGVADEGGFRLQRSAGASNGRKLKVRDPFSDEWQYLDDCTKDMLKKHFEVDSEDKWHAWFPECPWALLTFEQMGTAHLAGFTPLR